MYVRFVYLLVSDTENILDGAFGMLGKHLGLCFLSLF
jgi:hypothetical protein